MADRETPGPERPPAGRFYGMLVIVLALLIAGLVLLVDVTRDYPAVRIGFSVAIAGVLAAAAKDAGERYQARRATNRSSSP